MAKTTVRKFFLFGKYSLALLIPKKWLSELGVGEQSTVRIEYEAKKKKIVLRFDDSDVIHKPNKPKTKKAADPASDKEDETWQPIPQL